MKSPPDTTITEVGSRGLRMTISRTGVKAWVYRHSLEGRLKQITLGYYPSMGISDARQAWQAARQRRAVGEPVALAKHVKAATLTVGDLIETYYHGHILKNRAPKGQREVRYLLDKFALPAIGSINVDDFDVPAAVRFLTSTKDKSLAAARMLRGELRAAWRDALEQGLTRHANPFADIMKGKLPAPRGKRYLTDDELVKWFKWLPKSEISLDARHALELTLRTACRSGEIVSLPWAALNKTKTQFTLTNTKTDAPRTVRVPASVTQIFKARQNNGSQWVFPSTLDGKHIRQHALVWAVSTYRHTLKIPAWSAHDLRRTARTGMARLGVSDAVGEAALGHTKGGVAGIYDLHARESEVGEALVIWNNHLDNLRGSNGKK